MGKRGFDVQLGIGIRLVTIVIVVCVEIRSIVRTENVETESIARDIHRLQSGGGIRGGEPGS